MTQINGKHHDEYFVQRVQVYNQNSLSRYHFLAPFLQGKKVLHVGFVDYPITNIENNLHIKLSKHCLRLDGYDPNYSQSLNQLDIENGKNYNEWDDIPDDYDFIIAPEVIEHVGNVESFLKQISMKRGTLIVTAPDSVLLNDRYQIINGGIDALEVVHPDHNCVYTPYTLKNVINKYSYKKVKTLHWIDNHSICAVCN